MVKTIVNVFEKLALLKNEKHRGVYYMNCVSMDDAKYSGINLCRMIYEIIEPEGQVLPHIHEVGEIIYITSGLSGQIQQQNQRHHLPPLAVKMQPGINQRN